MEIKFSYHPIKRILLVSSDFESHSDTIHKKGRRLSFDQFIRGIIKDNVLYLRVYYPFNDIDEKSGDDIREKSFDLLFNARKAILKDIKAQGLKIPRKLAYNVNNDDLKGVIVNI